MLRASVDYAGVASVGPGPRHPALTGEPTGLIALDRPGLRLGDFFRIWGRPLRPGALAGFEGPLTVHVDGRRWEGHPGEVALPHHAQIVVQAGRPVAPPYAAYTLPAGR